jgi:PAS domain S-box-containing protein
MGDTPFMITVLLVDDDVQLLEVTRIFLERGGFSVVTAESGAVALDSLQKRSYDVVVSDYEMPGMDGLALLAAIRSSGMTIPFIIFTGRGREEVAIRALNEGADFYIRKGGDPKSRFAELGNAIRRSFGHRESERRMRALISALPDPTFAIDQHGVVTIWNRAMEELTGVMADQMIGRGDHAYAVPIYGIPRPMLIDIAAGTTGDSDSSLCYTTFRREGDAVYAESSAARPKGVPVILWGKATPILDDAGRPAGAIETIRDITSRVAIERDLQSRNEFLSLADEELRLRMDEILEKDLKMEELLLKINDQKQILDLIFESSPIIFFVYDKNCRFRYVSEKVALLLGITRDEMVGRHWREIGLPADLMEPVDANIRATFDTGKELIADTSYPTVKGLHHFRYILTPIHKDGVVDQVLSTAMNITEFRRAEDLLREQDTYCHLLFESAGDGLLIYDGDLITDCNQRAADLFGFQKHELIGRVAGSISPKHQPDGQLSREMVSGLLKRTRDGELTIFEWQGLRSDGTLLDLEVTLNQVKIGGRMVALAVIRDISNRKREEQLLKDALMQEVLVRTDLSRKEAHLTELLTALPGMVYRCDNDFDWTMRFVSEGAYDLTGYRPRDLIGNQVVAYNDLILPEYRDQIWQRWQTLLAEKGFFEGEYPIRRRDGVIRWVWERGYGVYTDDGSVVMLEGFITDVTDRRTAEESLRHVNEKLHLLSSITRHDVKNRLGTILGYIDLMEGPDPVVPPDEAAPRIRDAVTRILRMIDFTKDYQALGSHGRSWLNLRLTALSAVESVDCRDIHVDVDLPSVEILADPLFERVIGNCIENAVRHGEGLTSIRLSAKDQDGTLFILCEDDGCGIPVADKERIFDRGVGKNTGLGLFLAREILRISGMSITEEGVSGQGATFVIRVPNELARQGGLISGEA